MKVARLRDVFYFIGKNNKKKIKKGKGYGGAITKSIKEVGHIIRETLRFSAHKSLRYGN